MNDHILLDTGILILFLRNQPGYALRVRELAQSYELFISTMTRVEIVRGMHDKEKTVTYSLLNGVKNIPITVEIADAAGDLIRSYKKQGIALADADALIAATALQHHLTLITTNVKHFPMPDLSLYAANAAGQLTRVYNQ